MLKKAQLNSNYINFSSLQKQKLNSTIEKSYSLILESELNKFIALDLIIEHMTKLNLPKFIAYGVYSKITDIILEIENTITINQLVSDVIKFSDSYNRVEFLNEMEIEKIEKVCFEKIKELVKSATKAYSNSADIIKEDLRNYIENELKLPAIVSTGLLTEFFYKLFININQNIPDSIFNDPINNSSSSFANYLTAFTYSSSKELAQLAVTFAFLTEEM